MRLQEFRKKKKKTITHPFQRGIRLRFFYIFTFYFERPKVFLYTSSRLYIARRNQKMYTGCATRASHSHKLRSGLSFPLYIIYTCPRCFSLWLHHTLSAGWVITEHGITTPLQTDSPSEKEEKRTNSLLYRYIDINIHEPRCISMC